MHRQSLETIQNARLQKRIFVYVSKCKVQLPTTTEERGQMTNISYAFAIGSIMYDMFCTQPNVSYALNATSMYKSNLDKDHWIAVKKYSKILENN
jgi:hypothetical protein